MALEPLKRSAPPMVSIPSNHVFSAASISSNLKRRVRVASNGSPSRAFFSSRAFSLGSHVRQATDRDISSRKSPSSHRHVCNPLSYMWMSAILSPRVRDTFLLRVSEGGGDVPPNSASGRFALAATGGPATSVAEDSVRFRGFAGRGASGCRRAADLSARLFPWQQQLMQFYSHAESQGWHQ